MTLLTWREAVPADREALMRFSCTEPPRRQRYRNIPKVYPKPWERVVEAYVRSFRPPGELGQTFLIGTDGNDIGAICAFVSFPPPDWMILLQAVAVARNYRGQGGAVADEALTVAMRSAFETVASRGHSRAYIMGRVHNRNLVSQQMCQRNGFRCDGPASGVADYQEWSVIVGD